MATRAMNRRQLLGAALMTPIVVAGTALDQAQGGMWPFDRDAERARFEPLNSNQRDDGWQNTSKATLFPFTPDTLISSQALQANFRRTYLLIQNKGPGNLYVNFGQAADALNSLTLSPTQVYELIGGGQGGSFVMRDSVWVLTDLANTRGIVLEGVDVPATKLPVIDLEDYM